MIVKNLILITFFFIMVSQLKNWFTCHDFTKNYQFSVYSLNLNLDDAIHNDKNLSLPIIRFYHNKVTFFILDIFSKYLLFWDIKFITNLISVTGVLGIIFGFWYSINPFPRSKYLLVNLLLMFLLPMLEIFLKPNFTFPVKIILFALPFQIFSYFGISRLLTEKKSIKIYLILTFAIWVTIFGQLLFVGEVKSFCN